MLRLAHARSFVVDLPGCKGAAKDIATFTDRRAAIRLNSGSHITLAQFEVCQDPGCFNATYEAAKLKAAKPCSKKGCGRNSKPGSPACAAS